MWRIKTSPKSRVEMTGDEERRERIAADAAPGTYTLSTLDTAVPLGTNLLVRGPPMSGKVPLQQTLLTEGLARDQGVVFASVTQSGKEVLVDMQSRIGGKIPRMGVIECNAGQSGGHSAGQISHLATPADLTGIGIAVSEWFSRFEQDPATAGVRFSLDSLSSMLMYAELPRVYRFMHVLTNRIRQTDGLGLFGFNPSSHDQKTVSTLSQLFDGQIVVEHDEEPTLIFHEG